MAEFAACGVCFLFAALSLPFFAVCWLELEGRRNAPPLAYALLIGTTAFWPLVTIAIAVVALSYRLFGHPVPHLRFPAARA